MRESTQVRKLAVGLDVVVKLTHTRDDGQTTVYKGTKGFVKRVIEVDGVVGAVSIVWGLDFCATVYTAEEALTVLRGYKAVEAWGTGRNRNRRVIIDTAYPLVK